MREKFLAVLPFSQDAVSDYTPDFFKRNDLPDDFTPIFSIRVPNNKEKKDLKKTLPKWPSMDSLVVEEECNVWLDKLVLGWKNLFDSGNGEEIIYDTERSMEQISMLPDILRSSLITHVWKITGLLDPAKLGLK